MLALQTDITSEYDRFFASHFAYAIEHSSKANDRLRQAGELLRNFDGRMRPNPPRPPLK